MTMQDDYEKLFSHLKPAEPSEGLFAMVISRIHKQERFIVLRRRIIFSIGLAISIITFFPALGALRVSLTESGFMEYFSLIFSDFHAVMTYWKSFSLTLLESLPVISLAVFLATVLVFLESLKFLAQDIFRKRSLAIV